MTTTPSKIRVRGLHKAFGQQTVLAGVDLDISTGGNLVLLGGSGSGKTVLAKCIIGLIEPDAGSVQIDGRETSHLSPGERDALWRKTGVLFQNGALFDSLPIWHNITFSLIHDRRMEDAAAREVALKALAAVGLAPETADLMPAEISGGMQKRVALARAIVGEPEILILDSPTDGLDPIVTTHIDALIVRALKRLNAAALTITHDLDSARRIGDRAAFLSGGRIVWEGPMTDLDRADQPDLAAFLGRAPDAAARARAAAIGGG